MDNVSKLKKMKKASEILLFSGIILIIISFCFMFKDLNGIALVFIIIGAILIAIALRIGNYLNHFCDKCYSSLAGCAYEYQEIKRAFRKNVNDYDLYITVQIRATCPNCGNIITIKKDFKINPGENPQYKVDEYCREYFKH